MLRVIFGFDGFPQQPRAVFTIMNSEIKVVINFDTKEAITSIESWYTMKNKWLSGLLADSHHNHHIVIVLNGVLHM